MSTMCLNNRDYEKLVRDRDALLEAGKQFVRYGTNGKHPSWANYLQTIAGTKLRNAIAQAEKRKTNL